jgi:parallel beta-helix repeat protein
MRKLRVLAVTLCVSVAALAVTVGTAQAATIVVYPGQSIQAAIDIANPGDTILVKPGVYHETLLIQTNRLKLQGSMASLQPPASPTTFCGWIGICLYGTSGDTVSGFLVTGFSDSGIFAYGTDHPIFTNNHTFDNGDYGIAAFSSTGAQIYGNFAQGSGEAGIYIGDSPNSNVSVHDNAAQHNAFGFLYRNSGGGTYMHNTSSHNCVGMVVLADSPGPASYVTIKSNTVSANTNYCPSSDAGPVSGAGIVLAGADHALVHGNDIENNVPSASSVFQGGVVVESGPGGTPASFNTIAGNTILHNSPDIFWDTLGHGNVFTSNVCQTSIPHGLCPQH